MSLVHLIRPALDQLRIEQLRGPSRARTIPKRYASIASGKPADRHAVADDEKLVTIAALEVGIVGRSPLICLNTRRLRRLICCVRGSTDETPLKALIGRRRDGLGMPAVPHGSAEFDTRRLGHSKGDSNCLFAAHANDGLSKEFRRGEWMMATHQASECSPPPGLAVFATGGARRRHRRTRLPLVYRAPPPLAPLYSWTGLYWGANIGYSWGTAKYDATLTGVGSVSQSEKIDGVGGVQSGYNYQFGSGWSVWKPTFRHRVRKAARPSQACFL